MIIAMKTINLLKFKEFIRIYLSLIYKNKRLLIWILLFSIIVFQNVFADPSNPPDDGGSTPDPNPDPNGTNNT